MVDKSPSLARQREYLERRIELERRQISTAVDEWFEATAPIDHYAAKLAAYKKPALLIGGFLMARMIGKRPRKLFRWTQRGIGLYALAKNLRRFV